MGVEDEERKTLFQKVVREQCSTCISSTSTWKRQCKYKDKLENKVPNQKMIKY